MPLLKRDVTDVDLVFVLLILFYCFLSSSLLSAIALRILTIPSMYTLIIFIPILTISQRGRAAPIAPAFPIPGSDIILSHLGGVSTLGNPADLSGILAVGV